MKFQIWFMSTIRLWSRTRSATRIYLTKNRDDVAQDYYDKANEIYSNISYPDSDDANYGSGVAAALRNEQQAKV